MVVDAPAEVLAQGFFDGVGDFAEVGGDVMFVAVLTDVGQQLLEIGNLHDAVPAKRGQLVIGEPPLASVGNHAAVAVVGRDAAVGERAGFDSADDCAVGVLFANGAGDNFLVVHLLAAETSLGRFEQWNTTPLFGSVP